jgi:hypothetical protein
MNLSRRFATAMTLAVLMSGDSQQGRAQQLDQLETDDYLDPRLFGVLAASRHKQFYTAWWVTAGRAASYHQRTESAAHPGFTATAVGKLYWRAIEASAKYDRVAAPGEFESFYRIRFEIAGYLEDEADTTSLPFRWRYARLFESRVGGITDNGWSASMDFNGVLPQGSEGAGGLIFTRFASRHETTFLYFYRYPQKIAGDWLEMHWGLQYGHTWFNGIHPGVERNAFKVELSTDFVVPGIPAKRDARVLMSYLPSFFPGRHVRHDLYVSGSFLFPAIWF